MPMEPQMNTRFDEHVNVTGKVVSDEHLSTLVKGCKFLMTRVPSQNRRHFNESVRKSFLTDLEMFRAILGTLDAPEVRDLVRWKAREPYVDHIDLLVKEAHAPITEWHQDRPYWEWDEPASMFTLWVALEDVDQSNGCLRIAGVTDTVMPHKKKVYDEQSGFWQYVIDDSQVDLSSFPVREIPLKAGNAVAFDSFVIHSAFANSIDVPRYSFKIVFGGRSGRRKRGGGNVLELTKIGWGVNRSLNYLPAFLLANAKTELKPRVRKVLDPFQAQVSVAWRAMSSRGRTREGRAPENQAETH